jgi:hypothetical protein
LRVVTSLVAWLGVGIRACWREAEAEGARPWPSPEVCLARTLRSEVEVLFWSPIGGIQHRRQGRGPELTGRSPVRLVALRGLP